MDSLTWDNLRMARRRRSVDAPYPLTLTEVRASVKKSRGDCCAIANGPAGEPTAFDQLSPCSGAQGCHSGSGKCDLQNTKDHSPVSGCQRAGSTTPTLSTPLHAIYTRPSEVAAIFRTVPPPEGIFARANPSVFGSNWMMVFGFTPDSLYQTIPSGIIAMPYGADFAPPGEAHIFTAPDVISSRPRWPPLKSVK